VGEFEAKLHPYLRDRIAGRVHVDVDDSTLDDVRGAAQAAIEAWARRRERDALDRLAEGVGRGGRGAAGFAAVLGALNEARVETLLLAEGLHRSGHRDRDTGMLYANGEAPESVNVEDCDDIVEPAIEKAIEQSAKVVTVRHHDDLGPLGGIGAVLRY
jgi:peptide subunit release factor 1 (eRF1)